MFTGLIEVVGRVEELKTLATGIRIRIAAPLSGELKPGDSIAVNGVCLTAAAVAGGEFMADIGPETARVTTLGLLRSGQPVNLERPLAAGARLGGHFVQGHVDGTGLIEEIRPEGDAHWLTVRYPRELAPLLIRRGSVAVDGISLTVAGLGETQFDVMIVPFTWQHTNLSSLRPGDRVNLECDMIGKYVARAIELGLGQTAYGGDNFR
ncbi:MAG TPA: riboflavin synthase [Vicinamibacterales bacterium]|nr:riboflavin synthase [Vicinamibacterales bacterium]